MSTITLPYKFDLRDYQKPFWRAAQTGKKYLGIVWARRHGKDLTCWNYAIDRASREPMDVTYVYPTHEMAMKNLWKAKTNDGFAFKEFVPWQLRRHRDKRDTGFDDGAHEVHLVNGSIIRLDTAMDPDHLRGANSKLYVLSEFAEMPPGVLDVLEPVVEANGGQIVVNFTPKGNNHAKGAWKTWEQDPDWFTQVITANDTNVFQPEQLERIKRRMIERFRLQGRSETEAVSFFEQEYLCNFDTPIIGSFYGDVLGKAQKEGRIKQVPYEPDIPVDTFWDLGVDDSTAIWFIQQVGREVHWIDYYQNNGEGLPHYARVLQDRQYVYGDQYAPHDIKVREMGTGKSRLETAAKLGIKFKLTPKLSVQDGIDALRVLLMRSWIDAENCKLGLEALAAYHKDWDDKTMTFRAHPKHDWSSHASDGARYVAVALKEKLRLSALPTNDVPTYAHTGSVGLGSQPVRNNYGRLEPQDGLSAIDFDPNGFVR